jgi:hypothetical protein
VCFKLCDCFETVEHDVPSIPEERHILVDAKLVQSISLSAELLLVILGSLIFERMDRAIFVQINNVVAVLYCVTTLLSSDLKIVH